MSEVQVEPQDGTAIEAPESAPVIEPQVAPVVNEPAELRYEWQPTDEAGRPIGGRQVIKYRTQEEFAQKMQEQNTLLIRKLREQTRKNRLGIVESETLPDTAQRFQEPINFNPRVLSGDERIRLSRDLLDPEKFEEASDVLFEAKIGAKPQTISQTLSELQTERIQARAKAECDAFVAETPSYVKCQENFEAITNWMLRNGLAPVKENFRLAFDTLQQQGIMIEAAQEPAPVPVVPQPAPVVVEPPKEEPTAPPAAEPPKVVSRVPLSLNRSNSEDAGAPRSVGDEIVYELEIGGQKRRFVGAAALDAMPADEFKRRVNSDPQFSKKVDQIEKERVERKRAKANRQ